MVEVFVPFLLIMMSWQQHDPVGTMKVSTNLYISQEECEKAGADIATLSEQEPADDKKFTWRCDRAPSFIEKYTPMNSAQ